MSVARILRQKRDTVFAVEQGESFQKVVDTFADHGASAVVVLNDRHGMEGLISERDVIRALAGNAATAFSRRADDIMTREVATCSYNMREPDIMKLMVDRAVTALPVLANRVPIGMVTVNDVMRLRVEKIAQLMKEIEKECQMFCPPQEAILFPQ